MDARARIADVVAARSEVVFALLFGSRAQGSARPDSDWDIAVYVDEQVDARGRFQLRRELAASLEPNISVDIVVLNDAPPLLAHRALCGELIVDRDRSRYVRFFVRTLGFAFDEAPTRQLHAEARRRRLTEAHRGR
jgi:predicted nucleotidyltransferase